MPRIIHLRAPIIERRNAGFFLKCVAEGAEPDSIWFEIDQDPGVENVDQVSDAFVLPAVLGAIFRGCDLEFAFPVSESLLRNLRAAIIPLLLHLHPDLFPSPVEITAEAVARVCSPDAQGSSTGLSCGLDSLATVTDLLAWPESHHMRLRATALFDVGNHDPLHRGDVAWLFAARAAKARACATDLGLPLYLVRSNVDAWIPGVFPRLHTYRNASAAFLLSPAVRYYSYANAAPIWDTSFSAEFSGYSDPVVLPLLSTEAFAFHSGTPALDSIGKAKLIADMPAAHRHLNVCLYEAENCSRCEKCLRRMLALDIIGALHKFAHVFDLPTYYQLRAWYIGYVLSYASEKVPLRELRDAMRVTKYGAGQELACKVRWFVARTRRMMRRRLGLAIEKF
jgi:hypothetical protein